MKSPIILHIGPKPPRGFGIVTYIEGLLKSNISQKYQILFLDTKGTKLCRVNKIFRAIFTLYNFIVLVILIIIKSPKIAHIHTSSGSSFWEKSFLSLTCKVFDVKVILHIHGADFNKFCFRRWNKFIVPKILSLMDMNVLLSKNWYEHFTDVVPKEKLTVIPNATDTSMFINSNKIPQYSNRINILFVGSIGRRKGLVDLAYASKNLINEGIHNFFIDIIGSEEKLGEFSIIKKIFKSLNLQEYTKFYGAIYNSQKIEFFNNADIFVLPSHNESFGISNLEAMASGLSIISTKVGAIPEYLVHGENGFLICPGNIDQLTKYLRILINDSKLREKMGDNNRKKVVEEFDWFIVSKKIDHLYQSLLL